MSEKEEQKEPIPQEEIKKFYIESFDWIRQFLKKAHTVRDLYSLVIMVSNALNIEAIYRSAELGREQAQEFFLKIKEERKRRKERPSFYGSC